MPESLWINLLELGEMIPDDSEKRRCRVIARVIKLADIRAYSGFWRRSGIEPSMRVMMKGGGMRQTEELPL
jgi:hypothetical protein